MKDEHGISLVQLEPGDQLGHCPECGCNGAMIVGVGGFGMGESRSWFRCYGCGTDWRPIEEGDSV